LEKKEAKELFELTTESKVNILGIKLFRIITKRLLEEKEAKELFELTTESKVNILGIKLFRIIALVKGEYE